MALPCKLELKHVFGPKKATLFRSSFFNDTKVTRVDVLKKLESWWECLRLKKLGKCLLKHDMTVTNDRVVFVVG